MSHRRLKSAGAATTGMRAQARPSWCALRHTTVARCASIAARAIPCSEVRKVCAQACLRAQTEKQIISPQQRANRSSVSDILPYKAITWSGQRPTRCHAKASTRSSQGSRCRASAANPRDPKDMAGGCTAASDRRPTAARRAHGDVRSLPCHWHSVRRSAVRTRGPGAEAAAGRAAASHCADLQCPVAPTPQSHCVRRSAIGTFAL